MTGVSGVRRIISKAEVFYIIGCCRGHALMRASAEKFAEPPKKGAKGGCLNLIAPLAYALTGVGTE